MKKSIIVRQDGIRECGVACLLSIIRYYGGNVSIDYLLELTMTSKEGTNFYNLSNAGNSLGLSCNGYKVDDMSLLYEYHNPFISQVKINNMLHFVVVYKLTSNMLTIMDPSYGIKNISQDEFRNIFTGYMLTVEKVKTLPYYEDFNYIKRIIYDVLINNKKMIVNLILLSLFVTLFTSIYSYSFQIMIDNIYTDKFNLVIITIIFLNILLLKNISNYSRTKLLLFLGEKLDLSIITNTFKRIIFLPYNYYKNKTTGDMTSRINDLFNIKNYIIKVIIAFFLDILLIITSSIILFKINLTMTLVLYLIIVIHIILFLILKSSIKNMTNINQENSANLNSLIVESLNSYETIKGLNLENIFLRKLSILYLKLVKNNLSLNNLLNNYELLSNLFESICLLFITLIGCNYISEGSLSIGGLITFNTIILFLINPIKDILELYKDYFYVKNSVKRINNLLNVHIEKLDGKSNLIIDGNIKIKNLIYSYNKRDNILHGINVDINNGDKVLLLGNSGGGKSTLLKLIYRYYGVKRDEILLGKYDINDYKLLDIRENIAYISQNEIIYTDTIRNNILLDRNVNDEDFYNICKLTKVDNILKRRNIDYDFLLEENGVNLSGGERQRIILARTLLKNGKIVLIDEGLNELDISLEYTILKDMFSYYNNVTFIIISHRKENISLYNRVLHLEEGLLYES